MWQQGLARQPQGIGELLPRRGSSLPTPCSPVLGSVLSRSGGGGQSLALSMTQRSLEVPSRGLVKAWERWVRSTDV